LALPAVLWAALRASPAPLQPEPGTIAPVPRYEAAALTLGRFIERQMREKKLPAFSIALVDHDRIVWAKGFGYADPARKISATAATVYRVGAISDLLTDVAVLQQVEHGAVALDAPVSRYLPDFQPENPYNTPITLRDLLARRSGLVREPPVGGIADASEPSLEETVASLNKTRLVLWPSTQPKNSDSAGAVAGYLLERRRGQPFAEYMRHALLGPLGMDDSSFGPSPRLDALQAEGRMWSYDGLRIKTPTFRLGVAPAEGLRSNVIDLGRFLEWLFADKRRPPLDRRILAEMWRPQFALPGEHVGYGLGFRVSRLDGHRLASRSGSIYGFSAELAMLPGQKLGVVAVTSLGGANGVTIRVAETALQVMLAAHHGHRMPKIPESTALSPGSARSFAGRYGVLATAFDLFDREGRLFFLPIEGGPMVEVRQMGKEMILDGRLGYGIELDPLPGGIRIGHTIYPFVERRKPKPLPARWQRLIGEYGPDYDTLYILEKDGKLTALADWFEYDPLQQISPNVYQFPRYGRYQSERAVFLRGPNGVAKAVRVGGVVFARRKLGGVEGEFFHIHPTKPIAELRREALHAKPPVETGNFRKPDLVNVATLDPKIKLDIRYATTHDFLGAPVYREAKAYLERPAAEALVRVAHGLERRGYGLLIHDAYRPWFVTKMFWDATPPDLRIFVANPREGSLHNRGCAVDLTLYDLATGRPVPMPSHYDEMSERAYAFYPGGTSLQRWDRNLLRRAMESEGFTVYRFEWWHFDYKDWRQYPILNLTFQQLSRGAAPAVPRPPELPRQPAPAISGVPNVQNSEVQKP
jgi:D-alanyl-D-alanine dipeptidase/CubicO group peptidase (beta-lactamase class C family)